MKKNPLSHLKNNLPTILKTLRQTLDTQSKTNKHYTIAFDKLLAHCQQTINPKITSLDIRQLIIQHILTKNIFKEAPFDKENIIAQQLDSVINTFCTPKNDYPVITHHDRQHTIKKFYENFYKTDNPKTADKLGTVYTPNEIVSFMIESTDFLLHKHFNRLLADDKVEILDPATGIGTFITALIEYLPKNRLRQKYLNEIYCNEIAILPYHIATLNIETTYKQKMGQYQTFPHIYFIDTLDLDNTPNQPQDKISVIIGNPPYNANNNQNKEYPKIDTAIKKTYIAYSTAQKTKLYDMYARFFRWATNRLSENGILAFITNSSFLETRTFDGFRKVVAEEFNEIYIIDLGGDIRKNPKLSGTKNNVFGIQTGVAISFMIKKEPAIPNSTQCKIHYARRPEMETAAEKLAFLAKTKFKLKEIEFERLVPDKNHNWLNTIENDFQELIPLANKETKLAKSQTQEKAIFKLYTMGMLTARDEWVYDFNQQNLKDKVGYFSENFQNTALKYNPKRLRQSIYRPFIKKYFYYDQNLIHRLYQLKSILIFRNGKPEDNSSSSSSSSSSNSNSNSNSNSSSNRLICVNIGNKPFNVLVAALIPDYHLNGDAQCLPLYRYDKQGNRQENLTDWGLNQFRRHYQNDNITKVDIFHYTYSVLHNPAYQKKYAINLKREMPRLPFYDDFHQWAAWGKQLIELHINYEMVEKYPLKRLDKEEKMASSAKNKPKLKAVMATGTIHLDAITSLQGVPSIAWEYKLCNRSALEWILDQYKEKKPRDKTIAEKFNTYRFADYKEQMIELLQRVCTVSVETMEIIRLFPTTGIKYKQG